MKNQTVSGVITGFVILLALLFFFPVYILLINSFKNYDEIYNHPLSLPRTISFENYINAWKITDYPLHLLNSLVVTVFTVLLIIIVASMAAYKLARTKNRLSGVLFAVFVSSIMVPIHVTMIPLAKMAKTLHLTNNLFALVLMNTALGVSMSIFLYHGFIKGIPVAMDESAKIDGCSDFRTFLVIILPLLGPITVTVAILNAISTWNAFLLPLLMLSKQNLQTLPLLAYQFITKYNREWEKQLSTMVLVAAPVVIFYLFMQKYIIKGISEGAVKG